MIKPDGVHRGLIGDVIKRFEQKGFKLVAIKFLQVYTVYCICCQRFFLNSFLSYIYALPNLIYFTLLPFIWAFYLIIIIIYRIIHGCAEICNLF